MVVFWRIGFEVKRREQSAQKQPVAQITRDQNGVFALPTEAGGLGQRLFHHRCCIDKHLHLAGCFAIFSCFTHQFLRQLLQLSFDDIVVIAATGINRDRATVFERECGEGVAVRPVIHAKHDNRAHLRPQGLWRGALVFAVAHPLHRRMVTVFKPTGELLAMALVSRCHAANIKAEFQSIFG